MMWDGIKLFGLFAFILCALLLSCTKEILVVGALLRYVTSG